MCLEAPKADKELAPKCERYSNSVAPAVSADQILVDSIFVFFFNFPQHGATLRKTIIGLKIARVLL